MLLVSTAYWLRAQPDFPTTNDFSSTGGNGASSVVNSGNEVTTISGFGDLHVMCWDGTTPQWSWSRDNTYIASKDIDGVNSGGIVSDPDIVVEPVNGNYAMIVYQITNGGASDIYYEVWERSGTAFSLLISSQPLTTTGNCSNPNIDVNTQGDVAIVWQDNTTGSQIYTRLSDIQGNLVGSNLLLTSDSEHPDVAISDQRSGTADVVVSYAFVRIGSGLQLDQLLYSDISSGSNTTLFSNVYTINNFGWSGTSISGTFRYPRIASIPYENISFDAVEWHRQCAVAVDYWCTNGAIPPYLIHSLTLHNTSASPPAVTIGTTNELLNKPGVGLISRLHDVLSEKPVITYNADFISVGWQSDVGGNSGAGVIELDYYIRRLLYPTGVLSGLNTYSIVNDNLLDNQYVVSLSGRHCSTISGGSQKSYFLLFDDQSTDMSFKGSGAGNTNFRTSPGSSINKVNTDLQLYPNPVSDKLQISFSSPIQRAEVFNQNGHRVFSEENLESDFVLPVDHFPSGIYLIRILSDSQEFQRKFQVTN